MLVSRRSCNAVNGCSSSRSLLQNNVLRSHGRSLNRHQVPIIQPISRGIRCHAASDEASNGADKDTSPPSEPSSTGIVGYANLRQLVANLQSIDDTNQLQTALGAAILAEDYPIAALIRDRLAQITGIPVSRMDWDSLGVPEWLAERAGRLGFKYPTEVQRQSTPVLLAGCDAVVQSETGSGKTLSFLVPVLARLDYPPVLFPDDLQGPQAIVLVPTMELGVQCCLLIYKLFGGNVSTGRPGDPANIFTYTGPRGIKVRGLLNKEEVVMAKETPYLNGVHVVVATPQSLVDVYLGEDRKPLLDFLKVLAIDEFDECFDASPEAMFTLLSAVAANNQLGAKPQVVMVGATIQPSQIELATTAGWLKDPVQVGKEGAVPSGLKHRFVVCEPGRRMAALVQMLRKDLAGSGEDATPTRAMVFASSAEEAVKVVEPLRTALWTEHRIAMLLPPGAPTAPGEPPQQSSASPQSDDNAAATSHELAGSSPFSATDAIRALHSFRDHKSSLLLCTPQAARGLDLPAVSHVYSLGCPEDSTQYLHMAGRAGRIGSTAGGTITTLLEPEQLPQLLAIAEKLQLTISREEAAALASALAETNTDGDEQPDLDKLRKGLEDIFNLL